VSAASSVICSTGTPLAGAGVFRSDVFQAGRTTVQEQYGGLTLIRGFINADVNGTLDVYQCRTNAQAVAITNGVPAAGTGDGTMQLDTFAFVSAGAANKGTRFSLPIVAPFVVVRFTNGAGAQATFSMHFEATE
jgi:hypothetical protein